jgi:hypothetical protein
MQDCYQCTKPYYHQDSWFYTRIMKTIMYDDGQDYSTLFQYLNEEWCHYTTTGYDPVKCSKCKTTANALKAKAEKLLSA